MAERKVKTQELDAQFDEQKLERSSDLKSRLRSIGNRCLQTAFVAGTGIIGAGLAMQTSPYEAKFEGVKVEAEIVTDSGIFIKSNLGNFNFNDISDLPLGVEITPSVTDVGTLANATDNMSAYVDRLEQKAEQTIPDMAKHFAAMGGLGLLIGSSGGLLTYRGLESFAGRKRDNEVNPAKTLAIGITGSLAVTGGLGLATYDKNWQKTWQATGMLTQLLDTPDKLEQLSQMDSIAGQKQFAALKALHESLVNSPEDSETEKPGITVLLISDMHLRNMYPQLQKYIEQYDVDLIINSGDETEFGSAIDLTAAPSYLESIEEITKDTPMIWVKGNHDSPEVAKQMDEIEGVKVLDQQSINAYGLDIAGFGDPRNYTDGGDVSSDYVANLEKDYASEIIPHVNDQNIDMIVTHHPAAAEQAVKELHNKDIDVDVAVSGHFHNQSIDERDGIIFVNTGSTGLGGVANISDSTEEQFSEFAIIELSDDCEPIVSTAFALPDPTLENNSNGTASITQTRYGLGSSSPDNQVCEPDAGIGKPRSWTKSTAPGMLGNLIY